jgi:hypothetical protein
MPAPQPVRAGQVVGAAEYSSIRRSSAGDTVMWLPEPIDSAASTWECHRRKNAVAELAAVVGKAGDRRFRQPLGFAAVMWVA